MPYSEALRAGSLEAIGMVVSESNDYRLATHLDGSENDGLRWLSALNGGGHGEHWTSADGERLGRRERRKNEQSRSAHRGVLVERSRKWVTEIYRGAPSW